MLAVERRLVALSAIREASQIDALRREEPLHWSELGQFDHERGFWSVVRFDDIAAVGRDHETFSSKLWIEETLRRFPDIALDGACERVCSTFLNQRATMPVRLS